MGGDEAVVRYIGGTPSTPTEAWARMLRFPGLWALLGYGYWTVEDRETGAFAGQAFEQLCVFLPGSTGLPQ